MNISIPHIIFGSLTAGFIGSFIHLIFGGKPLRLLFSLLFSWIGFWAGNSIGNRYQINILIYGTINFGTAILASFVFGLIGYWISGDNRKEKE